MEYYDNDGDDDDNDDDDDDDNDMEYDSNNDVNDVIQRCNYDVCDKTMLIIRQWKW